MCARPDGQPADLPKPVERPGGACEASVDGLSTVDEHYRVCGRVETVRDARALADRGRATRNAELLDPRCDRVEADRVREHDRAMLRNEVDPDLVIAVRAQAAGQIASKPPKRQPPGPKAAACEPSYQDPVWADDVDLNDSAAAQAEADARAVGHAPADR